MKVHKLKIGDLVYFPKGAAFNAVSGKVLEVLDIKAECITLRFDGTMIGVKKDYMECAKRVLYKERFRKLKVGDKIMSLTNSSLMNKGDVVTVTGKYHGADIGFDYIDDKGRKGTAGHLMDISTGSFMAVKVK